MRSTRSRTTSILQIMFMESFTCRINSSADASDFLEDVCSDLISDLSIDLRYLHSYQHIEEMENYIFSKIDCYFERFKDETNKDFNENLYVSLECIVVNELHDVITKLLYQTFREEDDYLFKKCQKLYNNKVGAYEFGANEDFNIRLPASVVELASLDVHKTALDKINTLCACYDLLYAELKLTLVESIVESNVEIGIPVVNNEDVIPVLVGIIIRSKLKHLYSNLYYVQSFTRRLMDQKHVRCVLEAFQLAVQRIHDVDEVTNAATPNACDSLDLNQFSQLATSLENSETRFDRQLRNSMDLIAASLSDETLLQ